MPRDAAWLAARLTRMAVMAEQKIVGFHQDEQATGLRSWHAGMDSMCGIGRRGSCGHG